MVSSARAIILGLLLGSGLQAQEISLDRAGNLRAGATEDWKAGRHEEACKKLREADGIYNKAGGDHILDRAIVLRALTFNLVKLGRVKEAGANFAILHAFSARARGLRGEMSSAYGALYQAARATKTLKGADRILGPVRTLAGKRGDALLAAQVLHDLGGIACRTGDLAGGLKLYSLAITERRRCGDVLGRTWSWNNRAYHLLAAGRVEAAWASLLEALRGVHVEKQVVVQQALAINLRHALQGTAKLKQARPATAEAVRACADVLCASRLPRCVSADRVALAAFALEPDAKAAAWLTSLRVANDLRAARALRLVRAALLVRDRAAASTFTRELADLQDPDGPVAVHVGALADLARMQVASFLGRKGEFLDRALAAWNAFEELGDYGGLQLASRLTREGAARLSAEAESSGLVERQAAFLKAARPGGLGGSASSSPDLAAFQRCRRDQPVFALSAGKGNVVVRDLLKGSEKRWPVTWRPRTVSVNGLVLTLFGGYVSIDNMNYGGAAVARGAPGQILLDELQDPLPLPGKGVIEILKNGALRVR